MTRTAALLALLALAAPGAADGRRDARPDPAAQANPLQSVTTEEPEPPAYRSDQRGRELWHLALKEFHAGRYGESEAAFALAYRRFKNEPDLLLDYAFCSVFYPDRQRSLRRARALHQEAVRLQDGPDPWTVLLEGLILWESGEKNRGRELLRSVREDLPEICNPLLARVAWGEATAVDADLAMRIAPLRRDSNRASRAGR